MKTEREQHTLVTEYLERLRSEAVRRLPADRAEELVADIREHLDEAVSSGAGEAEVRTALDRVGEPSDLVDEADGDPDPAPDSAGAAAPESNRLEVAGLVCLVSSVVLFLLYPFSVILLIAGMVCLFLSRRWTTADKVIGALTYLVLGFPFVLVVGVMGVGGTYVESCSQPEGGAQVCEQQIGGRPLWVNWVLIGIWLAWHVYVAIRLARRGRVRS